MRNRILGLLVCISLVSIMIPATASAQAVEPARDDGGGVNWSIGPEIGYEFETENLFAGARARIEFEVADQHWLTLAPAFDWYFAGDNMTMWQVDANVLYNFAFEAAGLRPFAGAGLAILHTSFDGPEVDTDAVEVDTDSSSTNLGLNLVGGAVFDLSPGIKPYVQVRYTIHDGNNLIAPMGGVYFTF